MIFSRRWLIAGVTLVLLSLAFATVVFAQTDLDGDGLTGRGDQCPTQAGPKSNNGCPLPTTNNPAPNDRDGDGVSDKDDRCPDQGGPIQNNGCPLGKDSDGDGTPDDQDKCPNQGGPAQNAGCPSTPTSPDRDKDGVPDDQDRCPDQPGLAAYHGCQPPLPKDGPCVAAAQTDLGTNLHQLPGVDSILIGLLRTGDTLPVLDKLDTPDGAWYLTDHGWGSGRALRFGGQCDSVEHPQVVMLCAVIDQLSSDDMDNLRKAGFDPTHCAKPGAQTLPPGPCKVGGDFDGDGSVDKLVGSDPGSVPAVQVISGKTGKPLLNFLAYDANFRGGVNVASGDVNGDGTPDIVTGAGPGGGPHVKVFDGKTGAELMSFMAYDASFTGGVFVAAGDVNGDGYADIVTGTGPGGGPHVKVFDGKTGQLSLSFFAYDASFTGGVSVAVGDLNGDCVPEIVTGAGPGGGPHVKVFDGKTLHLIASFFAASPTFTGGVRVSLGDVNGDGRADIIAAMGDGSVRNFDGGTLELVPAV